MFFRRESSRERMLLRLVESQQRTIDNLLDRLMLMSGTPWMPPPEAPAAPDPRKLPDELEESWTAAPEQEPVY